MPLVINPFVSEAQRAWMYANDPAMAKEWEKHTPAKRRLPKRKKITHNAAFHNVLRMDPSRTTLLRRSMRAEIKRRLDKIRRAVWQLIVVEDGLGLQQPTANAPSFKFDTDDQKLKKFNRWLQKQIDDGVLETHPVTGEPTNGKPWMYRYIDSAYKKGAVRSYIDTMGPKADDKQPFYQGSKRMFLESSFNTPEKVTKLRLLYTRTYENLKGVTSAMSTAISRQLADGIAHGKAPRVVARQISKTITGISRQRANVIAQTEIMHAHAEGQLDSMEDLGVQEVGAEVEFTTAGDDGVCPVCESLEGKVYSIDAARGVIPVHPNCRCTWMPVLGPMSKQIEEST